MSHKYSKLIFSKQKSIDLSQANDQVQRILRAAIIFETHPQSQIRSQNSVATTCYAAAIALTALSIINVNIFIESNDFNLSFKRTQGQRNIGIIVF
jgi:hypothetical protein